MTTFTLTIEQIKEVYQAGVNSGNSDDYLLPHERLAFIIQDMVNEGVSVHNKNYKHMDEIISLLEL